MPGIPKLMLGRSGSQEEYQGIFGRRRELKEVPELHGNLYSAVLVLAAEQDQDHMIIPSLPVKSFAFDTTFI